MKRPQIWLTLIFMTLALCMLSGTETRDDFFRIEDLRPGMKGIGKTCFQGVDPEDFEVEILGVLRGISPGADAVLARFSGDRLDKVGVFEGMSGSPVFIDGKILGAVAYSYAYSKEAIGGITPITQMVAEVEEPEALPSGVIYKKSRTGNYQLPLPSSGVKPSDFTFFSSGVRQVASTGGNGGKTQSLIPISTPVGMSGVDPRVVKAFAPAFLQAGMSLFEGTGEMKTTQSTGAVGKPGAVPFRPGDNIVVSLVEGDLNVSAGGTVTWVDDNRLYAFGHELMTLGFTELPMRKASAITVIPNLESSFKILEAGETAGVIRQDRSSGIFGIMGERPRLMPLRVRFKTSRGVEKTFRYDIVRDALLTPMLVNLTLYNTIVATERAQGALTVHVRGRIRTQDQPDVVVDNRFSTDSGVADSAALSIALPVHYLMAPGYENLELEGIDLEVSALEQDQAAALESIRLDQTEAKAGGTVELTISCLKANGTTLRQRYPVKIPDTVSPGNLSLIVADGSTLTLLDDFNDGGDLTPRDLSQLIRHLNNMHRNDRLYVRLFRRETGAVIGGEGLPNLPPTILSILNSVRETGSVGMLRTVPLMEYELPATEFLPTGSALLELTVKP